ncbi:MAG: toll/interleukin-1 receptor domain-containing protein [Desulfobacterales bacterium]|jgi:hypothetical protein
MLKVFISYTRQSEDKVRALAADIEELSHNVWCDQQLSGGQFWWNEILKEIRNCDVFVFALSQETLDSEACRLEFKYAVDLAKPVLPVLVAEGVPMNKRPPELSKIQFLDYVKQDKDAALKLSRALSKIPSSRPLPDSLPHPPDVPVAHLNKESTISLPLKSHITQKSQTGKLKEGQEAVARELGLAFIFRNGIRIREVSSTIAFYVAFVGLVVISTYYVQSTLVVARGVGVYAHWTVVLMVIPLLSGLVLRLLRAPNVIFIIGAGSVVTAGVLLYLYNRYLFAQPLNPLGGVFYAFVLAGLSYIPNIRLRSRGDVASEPVEPAKGNSPDAFDFFGGIKYGGAIAILQLLVSILALVFSIVGIFIGSSVRG